MEPGSQNTLSIFYSGTMYVMGRVDVVLCVLAGLPSALNVCLSVCLSVCSFVCQSVSLSVCFCQSECL